MSKAKGPASLYLVMILLVLACRFAAAQTQQTADGAEVAFSRPPVLIGHSDSGNAIHPPTAGLMAGLRPGLSWKRTPAPASNNDLDGPILYQLVFSGGGTPNTIAKFDKNSRHLINSLITDNGNIVAVGNMAITSNGIITFAPGQGFPGVVTSVAAGTGLTGGPITTTGTLSLDLNYTDLRYAQATALNNEINARQNSDITLQNNIDAEAAARVAADALKANLGGGNNFTGDQIIAGNINAINFNATGAVTMQLPNDPTGTANLQLAKLNGGKVVAAAPGDTSGVIGIVISGAGVSGNAVVAIYGQANCIFDTATTTPGDYVQIGAAGQCHDSGSTSFPASGQVVGRVLTNNSGRGTPATVAIFGSEDESFAGGRVTDVAASAPLVSSGGTKPVISIQNSGIPNSSLTNSSLTVTAGTGLTGGGTVPLGGSTTLNVDTTSIPTLAANNIFTGNNTFGNPVVASITGNAATASNAVNAANAAQLGGQAPGAYEQVVNKNTLNGYAGLDSTARIAKAQAPVVTAYTDTANIFGADQTVNGNVNASNFSAMGAFTTEFPNDVAGTTNNLLAKLNGGNVRTAQTGDTAGIIGVVVSGAGTSGNALVAVGGQASCLFDNISAAGNYVQIGISGQCHDTGSVSFPASGQVIGRALTANAGAGTAATVALFGPEDAAFSGGTVTSVNTGPGLTGGPITSSGTISIPNAGVINAMLANSSVTINPGAGLSGGGAVSLGGTTTLSIPNAGVSNAMLANSSVTVNAGTGLSGGGTVALGGAALTLANTGVLSFNGRTGAVGPIANDYSFAQLSGTAAKAQLPTTTAYIDTANTFTANQSVSGSVNATNFNATGAITAQFANDVAGTANNRLAKLNGGNARTAQTGDAAGILGVVIAGAGTSGNAQIAILGLASCIFDNASTTAGDYVQIGAAGQCHDTGSNSYPASGQVLGRVITANSGVGTAAAVVLFGAEDQGGVGTVTSVATGAGLTGGPITTIGTISIPAAGVTNAMLANSSVTVSAGTGISGGGTVALGGSLTLNNTGVTNFNGRTGAVTSVANDYSFGQLSGSATKAQLPATIDYTDQANTHGAFPQVFQAETNFSLTDTVDLTKVAQFNLANIATATTRTINIPNANSTTIQASTAPTNQFANSVSSQGVVGYAQPSFASISGTATDAQLASAYSGVGTCPANQFANTFFRNAAPGCAAAVTASTAPANQFASGLSAAGVVTYTQPAFSNLSGVATAAQLPATVAYTNTANTFTATQTMGQMTVNTGITNSGTGIKHARVAGCLNAASASCNVTITWPGAAFPDTNYTSVCTLDNPAPISVGTAGDEFSLVTLNKTTTQITVQVEEVSFRVAQTGAGTINCIAIHD